MFAHSIFFIHSSKKKHFILCVRDKIEQKRWPDGFVIVRNFQVMKSYYWDLKKSELAASKKACKEYSLV